MLKEGGPSEARQENARGCHVAGVGNGPETHVF